MTLDRKPKIAGSTLCTSYTKQQDTYTVPVVEAIIAKTGREVVETYRIVNLQNELAACAWWYFNHRKTLQAQGRRDKAAWDKYVRDLMRLFEIAFGQKVSRTDDGPFARFMLAALEPIGLTDITAASIKAAVRRLT